MAASRNRPMMQAGGAVDVNAKINMTKYMCARYLFGIKTWNRNEKYAVNW